VDDVFDVSGFKRGGYLPDDTGGALQAQLSGRREFLIECMAVEPFHHQVCNAIICSPGVFDVGNIFVIEMADNLCFLLEKTGHALIAERHIRLKDFEGHLPFNPDVLRAIDGSHSADADKRLNSIFAGKGSAD
jgi:hypothetical protein